MLDQTGASAGVPLTLRLAAVPGLPATAGRPGVAPSTKPPQALAESAGANVRPRVWEKVHVGGSVLSTRSAPMAEPPLLLTTMV